MKCAICNKSKDVYPFIETLRDLRIECEGLNIKKPVGVMAHPSCVSKLIRKVQRKQRRVA